jgi:transcriptional regulator with XRE-family HTH domain
MTGSTSSPDAGKRLRGERLRVRLSTREVERLSQAIAQQKNNQEYSISHAWLTDVENGEFTPSFYKLYSLSLIYGRTLNEVMGFFGLHVSDFGKDQQSLKLPRTHLVGIAVDETSPTITAPVELRHNTQIEGTNLVSRMFEKWGEVPLALLQRMDLKNSLYGYVGSEDYTLYPLIRPGSFVQIDPRQNKIKTGDWQNEFDRPIYFIELRDSYACSWCELRGNQLTLVPYPHSRGQLRQVRYPFDAEVVGRVTGVTMCIAEPNRHGSIP